MQHPRIPEPNLFSPPFACRGKEAVHVNHDSSVTRDGDVCPTNEQTGCTARAVNPGISSRRQSVSVLRPFTPLRFLVNDSRTVLS